MYVRNTLTGLEGYVKVYTWWNGLELPVFVNGDIEFWKQSDIEILHDRPIVKRVKIEKKYRDPFEGYTENEIEEMWENMTAYQMLKEFFFIDRLKRITDYLINQYRKRCSKS
jgi:hypothetical protein